MAWLPDVLRASDGAPGKPSPPAPEDFFTWDDIFVKGSKILSSAVALMPEELKNDVKLTQAVQELQEEIGINADLKPLLLPGSARTAAVAFNSQLEDLALAGTKNWLNVPWLFAEAYMYKRLLQALDIVGATSHDPFHPHKQGSLEKASEFFEVSSRPILNLVDDAVADPQDSQKHRAALKAAVLFSLWGNRNDLTLSAGNADLLDRTHGELISDNLEEALSVLDEATGRKIVIVLDNHGPEVVNDILLTDALFRLVKPSEIVFHVKDSPTFVSDVTEADMPPLIDWFGERAPELANRLRACMKAGTFTVKPHPFYTSGRVSIEMPEDLLSSFSGAVAILKGDLNTRRLLLDRHWPRSTAFGEVVHYWPSSQLIVLRTLKSACAVSIDAQAEKAAKEARPQDWMTSGWYGQILCHRFQQSTAVTEAVAV